MGWPNRSLKLMPMAGRLGPALTHESQLISLAQNQNMKTNLYLIVAVLTRISAIGLILSGSFSYLAAMVGGIFFAWQIVSIAALLIPVLAGIVLWYMAKPIARLVVTGLE